MKDLGKITNLEVLGQLVDLQGKFVVDAGCGAMTFTRLLIEQGARVLAIDPDSVQAEKNRAADPIADIEFVESGADKIPTPDDSVDGVFFSYSLHHIPAEIYPAVFEEVFRVLRPDGFLFVLEPIDCPLNQVMKHFHNEDIERAAAWNALEQFAVPVFNSVETMTYHNYTQYESWDDFANHFSSRSFNSLYTADDVRNPKVREAFDRLGAPDNRFQSPKNVMVLRGLK